MYGKRRQSPEESDTCIKRKVPSSKEKDMKFIIEDSPFIYQVDWAMKNKIDGDTIDEYRPDLEESIEAFLELLENIFSKEKIVSYLKKGIQYSSLPPE